MQRPNGWSRIAINPRQSACPKGVDDLMGGFPQPKSLGHACKAIVQFVETKLMLALKDVITVSSTRLPGEQALQPLSRSGSSRDTRRLTGNHPQWSFWIRRFASGDNLDKAFCVPIGSIKAT
jgi:hypothetical protein